MKSHPRTSVIAVAYSVAVLAAGTAVSVITGDWIGLLCATGLVVLPLGAIGTRRRSTPAA